MGHAQTLEGIDMNPTIFYSTIASPIGELLLRSDGKSLTGLFMTKQTHGAQRTRDWQRDDAALHEARTQLQAYFAGELRAFELPLAAQGTPFQQEVWRALCDIPYGETISYGELARRIGQPTAARAVGLANGQNPIAVVVPCHRVIGANGALTGYGGGLARKRWLLAHESRGSLI
jgi:methylated-DNA-[protein]-cysteine S-methyltransferase